MEGIREERLAAHHYREAVSSYCESGQVMNTGVANTEGFLLQSNK